MRTSGQNTGETCFVTNMAYPQLLSIEDVDNPVHIFDVGIEFSQREWNLSDLPQDILFQISYEDKCAKYSITYSSEDLEILPLFAICNTHLNDMP